MTSDWEMRILRLLRRETSEQDVEFVGLVNEALGKCDLGTCKILLKTFVTDDDFGVQEIVVSVLSSARIEDYQTALLEELPRMQIDAPEWSEVLVERELKYHLEMLRQTLVLVSLESQNSFRKLLQRDCFREQYGDLTIGS